MANKSRFHPAPFFISLAVSLGVGLFSALATRGSMDVYKTINLPPLSPPGWLFPIVWTILFILMGISAYLVFEAKASPQRDQALILYVVQLAVNAIWPVIFFNLQAYLPAFLWLCLLWVLILGTILAFYKINPTAALLLLPYLLWVSFAGYLNLAIYFLNR